MVSKPAACDACPLKDKGLGFVPDKVSAQEKVRFYGEAPTKQEVDKGEPFVGKAGFVLHEWLIKSVTALRLQHERGAITFANTLRCLPPEVQGRAYPRGEERLVAEAACRGHEAPLARSAGHTVILFGDGPQRSFFRDELDREDATDRSLGREVKGVMGRIGRVYERDGSRYVFAPHPSAILSQPMLVAHAVEALKIAMGASTVEPSMVPWSTAVQELSV
jgi:uracil-DNA glycosylase family 4